ncbi:phage tail tube protein [Streptomyces rubiginosohelvolus]|uniref:phage tail tube protein n=1 Tax=Streptomyces rubiginosohelvolus TaxID=67362 RepID=UPI0035DEEBC3
MAIGSGLGAQVGIAAESSYGTYVAPTKFVEFTKESLQLKKVTAQSQGIAANRLLALAARRVVTQRSGAGNLEMEVTNKAMGTLLQTLMGTSVTPVQQAATAAYLQTHVLADTAGKSLTIQKGVPLTTGTVTRKNFLGCKIISAEFSCEVGGMLTASFEIDSKDCEETSVLAVATYPSMAPFHFAQMSLKTGVYASEVARNGIRKVSVKIERPQATERYYAGQSGTKAEPIANDLVKITGSIEGDYVDTILDDLHTSDATTALVWDFTGPLIAATHYERFTVKLPAIKIDDAPPTVEGYDVVKPTLSFTGLYDGTNQPSIEYMSTDVTL